MIVFHSYSEVYARLNWSGVFVCQYVRNDALLQITAHENARTARKQHGNSTIIKRWQQKI